MASIIIGAARLLLVTVIAALICPPFTTAIAESIIDGSRQPCQNEGETVEVDTIKDMSCFQCICKNGFVECEEQETCPDVKNCYMQMPKEGCCIKCKGCLYKGAVYASDSEWSDPEDPCRVLRCEAGVVTESNTHCYTPCENPRPPLPGQCCPSCHGCHINGQKISEGRDATIPDDPCLKCHCSKGKLTCLKRACAVLACPMAMQVTPHGECCPVCSEPKMAKMIIDHNPQPCILGKDYHYHGKSFVLDRCTHCSCVNGTTVCERISCPVLECASEHQKTTPGECCPHCPPIEEVKSTCTVAGKTYEDGESWRLDECKSCMCHSGEPRCAKEQCPSLNCPAGHRKEHPPGQCCPRCIESDGVCTVYGDPHYKTFDGKFFSYQGSCKYQLTSDCTDHTFSIRVTNDARSTKYSSWTKNVSLKLGDTKINLGRKLRVKVDRVRIDPPYIVPGNIASIERKNDTIIVKTEIGIKLLWDGAGFLEVSAPTVYKNKLCGLCGNFNSIGRDDLKMRNGIILKEVTRESVWKFGSSWRVGGKKACSRKEENLSREKPCHKSVRRIAHKKCRFFTKSEAFAICRNRLNPHNFYEACIMDMCECPTQTCYCDAYSAYARECSRLGIFTSDWKQQTECGGKTALRKRRIRHQKSHSIPPPLLEIAAPKTPSNRPPTRKRPPPPMLH